MPKSFFNSILLRISQERFKQIISFDEIILKKAKTCCVFLIIHYWLCNDSPELSTLRALVGRSSKRHYKTIEIEFASKAKNSFSLRAWATRHDPLYSVMIQKTF